MVENLPYNAGDLGSIPGQGGNWDCICHRATTEPLKSGAACRNHRRLHTAAKDSAGPNEHLTRLN